MDQTLKKNTLIFSASQILAKLFGFVFIYFLVSAISKEAIYIYTYSYVPCSLFSDFCTIGFVPGTSKLANELANENKGKLAYLLKRGILYMLAIGFISFLIYLIILPLINKATLPLSFSKKEVTKILYMQRIASIQLLINPIVLFSRGFSQGIGKIKLSAISIITEQIVKTILFVLVYIYIKEIVNINVSVVLIFAFVSGFLGSLISIIPTVVLEILKLKCDTERFNLLVTLLKLCIPFGLTTIFFTLYQTVDNLTLSKGLQDYGIENINDYYSAYLFEVARIIYLPILLSQSLSASLMPDISTLKIKGDTEGISKLSTKAMNLAIDIVMPVTIFFFYFSSEIYKVFYNNSCVGGQILKLQSILIMFFGIYKVMLAISQGIKKVNYIVLATIISTIAKAIMNIMWIPIIGYEGAFYSSLIAISICLLTVLVILRINKIRIFKSMVLKLIQTFIFSISAITIIMKLNFSFELVLRIDFIKYISCIGIIYILLYFFFNKFVFQKCVK